MSNLVNVGDRVRYSPRALQHISEGHLMVGLLGTVRQVMDTPNLTVKRFAQVEWDEPLLCLPNFVDAKVWVVSAALEVVSQGT